MLKKKSLSPFSFSSFSFPLFPSFHFVPHCLCPSMIILSQKRRLHLCQFFISLLIAAFMILLTISNREDSSSNGLKTSKQYYRVGAKSGSFAGSQTKIKAIFIAPIFWIIMKCLPGNKRTQTLKVARRIVLLLLQTLYCVVGTKFEEELIYYTTR